MNHHGWEIRAAHCCPEGCHQQNRPPSMAGGLFLSVLQREWPAFMGPYSESRERSWQIMCEKNFVKTTSKLVQWCSHFSTPGLSWGGGCRLTPPPQMNKCFRRSDTMQRAFSLPTEVWHCSLFSLKLGLVCSVNKASELIGDLKDLEGKGHALK